ncbi:hypothetical protein AN964_11390 [Heyndrickxia shackletonii]|uniref:Aminoglycoside phosphotransferase domain-containing protein n=1 Tax=Heyndrickxia shackletonii TaxID=157838 RepID=A0A0Q3TKE4_9BACI|nr:phosphotransferase [Heyndrickxia shackletonii]KQL54041.1 hypothetical protein AN964_11390 [Heyndrickxia shackletonii]NEZ02196.1 hypothetical protein [Heyndrickxia shackletonii]
MFKRFYLFIKRKKDIMHSFNRNLAYMSAGTYAYDNSIKYIMRCDRYTIDKANEIFQKNYYQLLIRFVILLLRKMVFNQKIRISEFHNKTDNFSGCVYRPVRSITGYNDSRIFDFHHNKVLTIFATKDDFHSVLNNNEYFKDYFPLPKILWIDETNLLIMEELIQFQQYSNWQSKDYLYIIQEIFNRYLDYFNDCKQKGNISYKSPESFLWEGSESHEIKSILNEIHPILLNMNYPCLKLHGDLWTANIMLIKKATNQICMIDWEYANVYLFFYDFFNLMWLEVYVNNNEFYIYHYMDGEMDTYFEKVFALFDLTFHKEYRLDYLYIFFLNFYKERVLSLHKSERHKFINRFKKTIGLLKKGSEQKQKLSQ